MKDDRYWQKRQKNNEAARVSREAKRKKENQIVMRAAFLESENANMKADVEKINAHNAVIREDVKMLSARLVGYHSGHNQQTQQIGSSQ